MENLFNTKIIAYLIASVFAAWEMRERLKARHQRLDEKLQDGPIEAIMVAQADGRSHTRKAMITLSEGRLSLEITSDQSGEIERIHQAAFSTRAELDNFLIKNTDFRLGDFIRG